MPTYTALTTLLGRASAEALGAALERLDPAPTGVGVFEIEDGSGLWEVGAYFTGQPDDAGLALLAAAFAANPFAVSELPETDWVAKVQRELRPVEAGRFFVYGAHDAHLVPQDRIGLLIEASMAFGTGHHGTTLGCLKALDRLIEAGIAPARIADIGCGTAVLAMAAARIWPAEVIASDIDPVAVEVARANASANGLADRMAVVEAEGFDHPDLARRAPYDLVFANILKGPLIALAPGISAHVADGGMAILSGILADQAQEVLATYAAHGFNPFEEDRIVDWVTLVLRKNTPAL
ncbi:MAG: 50S ribosomal protein L11 methyltransferase [Pseudomonadota bacterium]